MFNIFMLMINFFWKYCPTQVIYFSKQCKVNVASIGVRQIQKRILASGFPRTVDVQIEALKQAAASNPKGRWWIKADACDVRKGLRESVHGTWVR